MVPNYKRPKIREYILGILETSPTDEDFDMIEYVENLEKEKKINDNNDDFGNIMIMALRYALGRRTYVTHEVPKFIMQNEEHINERVCIVFLRDVGRYIEDRKNKIIEDDSCDYNSWINLQNWLFKIAKEKKFNIVGYERR